MLRWGEVCCAAIRCDAMLRGRKKVAFMQVGFEVSEGGRRCGGVGRMGVCKGVGRAVSCTVIIVLKTEGVEWVRRLSDSVVLMIYIPVYLSRSLYPRLPISGGSWKMESLQKCLLWIGLF